MVKSVWWRTFAFAVLAIVAQFSRADDQHALWQSLLSKHVYVAEGGYATTVDYSSFAKDRAVLARYLETLSAVSPAEFDRWSDARQLAFLVNAYNAWTVELILRHYPGIDSIREIGGWFRSPWKLAFFELLGKRRSLDELEHEMIRENYAEPRIHFAVNCASIGCPALAREPYRGDELERQLEAATQRFLSDRQRNGLSKGALRVSPIFDWYEEDFAKGWRGLHSLPDFLAHYGDALGLSSAQQRQLRSGALRIRHTDYNWALNKRD